MNEKKKNLLYNIIYIISVFVQSILRMFSVDSDATRTETWVAPHMLFAAHDCPVASRERGGRDEWPHVTRCAAAELHILAAENRKIRPHGADRHVLLCLEV